MVIYGQVKISRIYGLRDFPTQSCNIGTNQYSKKTKLIPKNQRSEFLLTLFSNDEELHPLPHRL